MGRKKRRNRGVVLLLLLLLLGGILLLYRFVGQMEEPLDESGNQTGDGTAEYTISNRIYTNIRALSYTYKGETLDFSYDGTSAVWTSQNEPNFPLSSDLLNNMAAYISSLSSTRKLDGDTGEYGFDKPTLEVSATYSDGASVFYKIGAYNAFAGGYYLLTEKGTIYIVSETILNCFAYSLSDMILLDRVPEDFDENELISVILTDQEGNKRTVTDMDDILELADVSVSAISLEDWVCAYASSEEKASLYGISDTARTVTLVYRSYYSKEGEASPVLGERTWTYCFGNTVTEADSEKIYFSLIEDGTAASGIVYQTDLSIYEAIPAVLKDAE